MDFIAGWPLLSFRESQGCKAVWLTVERQRGSDATSSPGFCPGAFCTLLRWHCLGGGRVLRHRLTGALGAYPLSGMEGLARRLSHYLAFG